MTESLQAFNAAHRARYDEAHGPLLPVEYGDFAGEVEAIRGGRGLLDLEACGVILVRGPDAGSFLGGLVTSDAAGLAPGRLQPSLICGGKGKILHPLLVVRASPDQFLLVTEPGALGEVAGYLEAYHVREQVEIGRVPLVRLELLGPGCAEGLAALGHAIAAPVGSWQGAPVLTLNHPLGPLARATVLLPAAVAPAWAAALLEQAPGTRPVGFAAYEEIRIRAGEPRFGVDYDREHLPAEAALYDRLSFSKGCYLGQEVHARLHYRGHVNRKLVGFELPEAMAEGLEPGAALYLPGGGAYEATEAAETAEAQKARSGAEGRVTSLARLAVEGMRRGIAMVRHPSSDTPKVLTVAPGGPAEVRLFTLPSDLGTRQG